MIQLLYVKPRRYLESYERFERHLDEVVTEILIFKGINALSDVQ